MILTLSASIMASVIACFIRWPASCLTHGVVRGKVMKANAVIIFVIMLFASLANAGVNWTFDIANPNVVMNQTDSLYVFGQITNLTNSDEPLIVQNVCPTCVAPVSLLIGVSDTATLDIFNTDIRVLDTLAGVYLDPGTSLVFLAYVLTPKNGSAPLGNYGFEIHDLFLNGYGYQSGGSIHVSVVPEPEISIYLLSGLLIGYLVFSRRIKV